MLRNRARHREIYRNSTDPDEERPLRSKLNPSRTQSMRVEFQVQCAILGITQ